jgi:hypothetical protein
MANKIKPKRSYTASTVPLSSDLDTHELAIRWDSSSPAIFTKDASGNIVTVTLGGGGSTSVVTAATVAGFPATGTAGVLYASLDTARIYEWQGAYLEMGVSGGGTDTVLRALFVPAAPTSVTATGGNGQATVSWTAPTVLAQTPITDYTVQYSSNSGSSWTTVSRSASTATSATVTGLTNGTAYVFRVAAVNAVGTGAYSTASSAVTPGVSDPYFSNVVLLLRADGSGSSFVDSSSAARTITAGSGATQSTTQFKWGSKSASFNGSSSSLTASIPAIGNTWTVEAWIYLNSRPNGEDAAYITDFRTGNGNNYTLGILGSSGILYFYGNGSDLRGTASITTGAWHHVAFVNDGGSVSLYLDGSRCGTTTKTFSQQAATVVIGSRYSQDAEFVNGYIDDLRISTVARYSGSSLTIPTAAFPDS